MTKPRLSSSIAWCSILIYQLGKVRNFVMLFRYRTVPRFALWVRYWSLCFGGTETIFWWLFGLGVHMGVGRPSGICTFLYLYQHRFPGSSSYVMDGCYCFPSLWVYLILPALSCQCFLLIESFSAPFPLLWVYLSVLSLSVYHRITR